MSTDIKEGLQLDDDEQKTPKQNVMYLGTKVQAAAGGRAAGANKKKPPGSRFNRPTEEDIEWYEATAAEREQALADDPVLRTSGGKDPIVLLQTIKAEVAKEAAALFYQRVLLEKMGKDITSVSGRRIDALKKIADMEMEMRKIGFDQIDVHSEKFQLVFKFWIETIQGVAEEVMEPETLDLFFNRLSTEMEGWEEKAEELVR